MEFVSNGAPFTRRHEPRARVARDAFVKPLRERRNEGILGDFLGAAHVAREPR